MSFRIAIGLARYVKRMLNLLALIFALLLPAIARPQKPNPASALQQELAGKLLALRSFSAATEIHASWDGHAVSVDEPRYRIFAAVKIASVDQENKQIILRGKRIAAVLNSKAGALSLTNEEIPVTIQIDVPSSDTSLEGLTDVLFVPLSSAIFSLPDDFGTSVIAVYDPDVKKYIRCEECLRRLAPGKTPQIAAATERKGTQMPVLTHSVEPALPLSATPLKAGVMVTLIIDTSGKPTSLWIARSGGDPWDRSAIEAVAAYRFKPAKQDGVPVAVRLDVDRKFETH